MAEPLAVTVDDDVETIRVDPVTGSIETDQPDGGVVVQLDARKPKPEDAGEDWFANLADDMDPMQLGILVNDLHDAVSADERSRAEYLTIRSRGLDLLGIKLEEPRSVASEGGSVEGMASVTNPLLLEAVLKGWANAQAELLPASGPVKIRDDGDESAAEDDQAEALERDTNHWFTTTAAEYYPDTSHMLLWGVYFGGSGFKKVYRCPMRRRPVSESVDAKDLIVSDTTKDLRSCGRITHQIPMRPSVMKRMKFIGAYRDVALTQPTPTVNQVDSKIAGIQGTSASKERPEDQPYTIWEIQCELDLDEFIPKGSKFKGEGIPLPYCVTMDKDSREILAIRRDWDENDGECERRRMYVKYTYVPGPGFYGTGMLNILGNSSAAMTAAWREALDTGMFANFPGGFVAKGGNRQNSSITRISPGQWAPLDTGGLPIGSVLAPNPYKDVTPGLMTLIDKVIAQAKSVGGAIDIPASEGLQNVPVGTILTQVEQATKIMAAAHKGMHQAQAEELQLILDLFRANPEDFWKSNKVASKDAWNEERFLTALDNTNLVPVSDPNVPSHIHRVAKALALVNLITIPMFTPLLDHTEVLKRCLAAIREDARGLVVQPPPQQAPGDPAKMLEATAKMKEADTKLAKVQVEAAGQQNQNVLKSDELASKERVANLDLVREMVIHEHDADKAQQAHDLAIRAQQHDEFAQSREHGLNVAQHHHEVDQGHHDRSLELAEHALNVHEVLHPPKPATPAKPKSKS